MRTTFDRRKTIAANFFPESPLTLRAAMLASALVFAAAVPSLVPVSAHAQASSPAAPATPRKSGTVKSADDHSLLLTTAGGDVTVNVSDSTKILIVPPGSTNLSAATPGTMGDIQAGDRALVNGSAADTATSVAAVRVVVMKSGAIEQAHAAQASAWAQGNGGIVKSVSSGAIVISSGMKTITVDTTPQTIVRRYSNGSIRFEDAVTSNVGAIQPGDQLRVLGTKSSDGMSVTADEIVTGSFRNYSGTIASIDGAAGTLTLKDLTTKKSVSVAVTANSDVRRLDAMRANMIAMRMKGGAPGGPGAPGAAGRPAGGPPAGGPPAGAQPAGGAPGGQGGFGGGRPGGGGGRAAGADLSSMLSRLPTETLGGLKVGEAVMIVASAPSGEDKGTAITLLVGVDPILAAPAGESTTLSPWSMGGGGAEGGGGEGGGGGQQ